MLTGLGLNVDAMNPDGRPDPANLKHWGYSWVRLVAHLTDEVADYVRAAQAADVTVLLVLARESFDGPSIRADAMTYNVAFPTVDHWQIGNEEDLSSPSSWTMTPAEYAALWNECAKHLGDRTLILGGLASGNPQYLADVLPLLHQRPDGAGIHPYGQAPSPGFWVPWDFGRGGVDALLDAYQQVADGTPLIVTEFGADCNEISEGFQARYLPAMATTLLGRDVPCAVFAWGDLMVPAFGIIRSDGTPRPSFAALQGVVVMPEFKLGFADLARELGPAVVGSPVEDEHYFPDGATSLQQTSKGLMIYSKAGNAKGFLPFA